MIGRGWRQGSILSSRDARRAMTEARPVLELGLDDIVVVVTHDCDLAREAEKEPFVELLVLRMSDSRVDGRLTLLKNPRRLQFPLRYGDHIARAEANVHERWRVEREAFLRDAPAARLPDHATDLIGRWLSRRYQRAALPDSFGERLRTVREELSRALTDGGEHISGLYLLIRAEELEKSEPYVIEIWGTMMVADYDSGARRDEAQQTIDALAAILAGAEGVDVQNAVLRSEATVTLDDVRHLTRWDSFDPMSTGETPAERSTHDL
jgi:hypothetical protein